MIYSPAVMYFVCKPDISETSKLEPVYALLAIISLEHTRQSKMKAQRSTETSVTLQLTGRDLHQHLCKNVMSRGIEDHSRIHKSPILDTVFILCTMIY